MHKLHEMLEKIEETLCEQLNHGINSVDTEEFGKVADIYKDLMMSKKLYLEACYYKSVVEAMDEFDPEYHSSHDYQDFDMKKYYGGRKRDKLGRYMMRKGYDETYMSHEMYRDMDRDSHGKMYYHGSEINSRDHREGRSGMSRKAYMQTKEVHNSNTPEDKQKKMKELENYMNELSTDIAEMIAGATSEEKTMLKTKLQTLSQKV